MGYYRVSDIIKRKGVGKMIQDHIYIHLDTTSNSLFSTGLTMADFIEADVEKPENILLLDPQASEGEYEPHTGLKVIRGQHQVERYFISKSKQREAQIKWIDFKDIDLLQQLTAMEVAELLYFGHMNTQLHSPFFYKLQNNFVYFEKPDKKNKVYYRQLDAFYNLLGHHLQKLVYERINRRKGFFKAPTEVATVPEKSLKVMRPLFQEGIIFDTRQETAIDGTYCIPLYITEDHVKTISNKLLKKENHIGNIIYHVQKASWSVELIEWDSITTIIT